VRDLPQRLQGERLRQYAVGQRGVFLGHANAAGEEGYRQVGVRLPQSLGHVKPVVRSEADVEQDERDRLACEGLVDLRRIRRFDDAVALEAQVDAAEHPEGRIVVCDKYRFLPLPPHASSVDTR